MSMSPYVYGVFLCDLFWNIVCLWFVMSIVWDIYGM
jgi:hypothetical protein